MHSLPDDLHAILSPAEPLAPLTWFRLGGPADVLARPRSVDQLVAVLQFARSENMVVRLLSGGSNVLVRDEGVRGLVVHLESPAFADLVIDDRRVEAGAAVPLTALISQTARAGLAGMESLAGIPGTVGGALRGNAGGRQGSIGSFVRRVTVLDAADEVQVREHDDLSFSYRWSSLDEPVILSAQFELETDDPEAVVRRMRRIWIVKKENQPYGHQSSGCIFKNPTPELSAGTLIDQSGLKGARVGGAEVSDRHANFIIAQPGATTADVLRLIDQIHQRIWEQFGYDLELQIQVW
jgi:UDP-N-acetylmuramate dehydrogenase